MQCNTIHQLYNEQITLLHTARGSEEDFNCKQCIWTFVQINVKSAIIMPINIIVIIVVIIYDDVVMHHRHDHSMTLSCFRGSSL